MRGIAALVIGCLLCVISGCTHSNRASDREPGEPDNSIYYSCSAIDPNGFNDARYCDPEVDRLERFALETYDRPQRKDAYARTESLVDRDVPYIFTSWQNEIIASNGHSYGWRPNDFDLSIANAQDWSI